MREFIIHNKTEDYYFSHPETSATFRLRVIDRPTYEPGSEARTFEYTLSDESNAKLLLSASVRDGGELEWIHPKGAQESREYDGFSFSQRYPYTFLLLYRGERVIFDRF